MVNRLNKHKLKTKNRLGEVFISNQGLFMEIIEYVDSMNCSVQFGNGFLVKNIQYSQVKAGQVINLFYPSVEGIGYLGVGQHKASKSRKKTKAYSKWCGILNRGYSLLHRNTHPSYEGVTVCEEWHNFQNFGNWFEDNYKDGFELDKDILIKGNKIYSPDMCVFVPHEINMLFVKCNNIRGKHPIGITKHGNIFRVYCRHYGKNILIGTFSTIEEAFQNYKTAKELHIKEVAEKWKDQINDKVYQALINYQVQITD